jgi:hypothetical protein
MKLNGVTFNNEDGKNRQDVLREISYREAGISIVNVVETKFEGERAVQVFDSITNQCIGWIPKDELAANPSFPETMTVRVQQYKGIMFADIMPTITPSSKQYFAVKRICKERRIPMPAYDARAYKSIIVKNLATVKA